MNKKVQPVTLLIMGKEYKIVCEEEEQDDLIHSAQQLDVQMRKMRDSGKIAAPDRIAVMAEGFGSRSVDSAAAVHAQI